MLKQIKLTNTSLLSGILLIGACLRFYHFFDIPFTHDEFSALLRTRFDTLRDLVILGVKTSDTHPPGIQVFLWLLTRLFGETPWVIKLPFALMGLGAIYLIYLLGKLWFNETVALLAAAVVSFSQYTIFYSQIARPYISGFFFCLVFAWSLSKIVKSNAPAFPYRWGVLALIFGGLSAYNHHFSLLTAAVMGVSMVFVVPNRFIWQFALIGVGVVLLYLPNLNILLYQLSLGGLDEWLAKPQPQFIFDFIGYIFHFSAYPFYAIIAIALYFWKHSKNQQTDWYNLLLVGSWFFVPLLVGYFYSVYVNPVIQFSVVIFGFAGFLFAFFGSLQNQTVQRNLLAILVLMATMFPTLITNRQHYSIFYSSPYEEVINQRVILEDNPPTWLHSQPHIIADFFQKGMPTFPFEWVDSMHVSEMISQLEQAQQKNERFYLGAFSTVKPWVVPLIQHYFPTLEEVNHYFNASTYVFNKQPDTTNNYLGYTEFEKGKLPLWDYTNSEALNNGSYLIDSTDENALEFQYPLKLAAQHPKDFIDILVTGKYLGGDASGFFITSSLDEGIEYWSSLSIEGFIRPDSTFVAIHSLKISDIAIGSSYPSFKSRLWNYSKAKVSIDRVAIKRRSGNPIIYGYQEPITKGW